MVDVVFDASALILTAKIGLLKEISHEINIHSTETIYEEATRAETYDAKLIHQRSKSGKLVTEKIPDKVTEKIMEDFNIDRGEASAIAYQRNSDINIVATDDKQAINTCKILDIKFTTTLRLLERTYEKEIISEEKALAKLKELDRYGWYKENQIKTIEHNIRGGKNQ